MTTMTYYTPEEAETAFYAAFERRDAEAIMKVFAEDDVIACVHPMGRTLTGHRAVLEGWRQIFEGDEKMHFEIECLCRNATETLAVHTVNESIYLPGDRRPRPPIVATNAYRLTDSGWRMILHHASPSVVEIRRQERPEHGGPLH